jgi:CSLREA domain-containing protein
MPTTSATAGSDLTANGESSHVTAQATPETTVTVDTVSAVIDPDSDTSSVDNLKNTPGGRGADGKISFPEALTAVNNTGAGFTINFDPVLRGATIFHDSSKSFFHLKVPNTTIDGDVDDNGTPDVNVGLIGSSNFYLLVITSSHNVIRNLAIEMLRLEGDSAHDNQIIGCHIGTDVAGLQARPEEGHGLSIVLGAHHNIVENNIIAGNFITTFTASGSGVLIAAGAHDNVVRGNKIGINRAGKSLPNEVGVFVRYGAWQNTIGGERSSLECNNPCNIISNNSEAGVSLQGTQGIVYPTKTSSNVVQGNFIGVGPTGADPMPNGWSHALGRGTGVSLEFGATQNTIGGARTTEACDGFCNVISGNSGPGVDFTQSETIENYVQGNFIGVGVTGKIKVPNVNGIWVDDGASRNIIGGERAPGSCVGSCNLIRGNTGAGVRITGQATRGNAVRGNDILYNGGLGIDLGGDGATPNDPLDVDIGPNDLMNFPVDLRAVYDPTSNETTIRGTLDTVNPASAKVDIYNFKVVVPPSFSEGWKYLGAVTPIPTSPDKFMFMLTVSGRLPLPYLTASATDNNGSTSELKASTITVNTLADELNSDGDCSLREAITAANTNEPVDACISGDSGADTITFSVRGTITSSPLPNITEDLTLAGPGVVNLIITRPDGSSPLRDVDARVTLDLQDLTIPHLGGACDDYNSLLTKARISEHFYTQYSDIGGALTISDYVKSLEAAWKKEVTDFGWKAPPALASNPLPGNRYHVRIDDTGPVDSGIVVNVGYHAGFVGNNPNTDWDDKDAYASCMVLNNDFSRLQHRGTLQQVLDATTAHELNHSIQMGYGASFDSDFNSPASIFREGGANWMEDEVFNSANENYSDLWPTFELPMNNYTDKPYKYWITFRGLTERYGTGVADGGEQVMQDFWEILSKSDSVDGIAALNTALGKQGTNLNDAFHAYAIAVKFNKPCRGNFVYPYCFKEGREYAAPPRGETKTHHSIESVGGGISGSIQDGYAIQWISLPTGSRDYQITLHNTLGDGSLRASVVCDTGSALTITAFPSVIGAGSSDSVNNFNPSGCSSIVAVITNQSIAMSAALFALTVDYPPVISGNAGVAGATLSYTDGITKTVTSDASGNYSFSVSYNWSGTVTPSKAGLTFTPASRSYTNVVADQTAQDYTATGTWETVGAAGFSAGAASYVSLAFDDNGTPYVAYRDAGNSYKVTVMKFDALMGNWVTVGPAGFSVYQVQYTSLSIFNGTPYVAFMDWSQSNRVTVMVFDGSSWVTVGPAGFSAGSVSDVSLAFDDNGTPYVAYRDSINGFGKGRVMKFNGSSWVPVGSPGFSADDAFHISLAIANGTPYVAYSDYYNGFNATVMKFNGSSWVPVGSPGFSASRAYGTSLAFDNGTPYVAYGDASQGLGKATVMKFNGSSWVPVGSPGFSAGIAHDTSLAIDNGIPYVAYRDAGNNKATVMKFDALTGNWVPVGSPGFSAGAVEYTSLALNNGTPYVAYQDAGNSYKATVMKFADATHTNTDIYIGGIKQESYYIAAHQSMRQSFAGVNNGPVRISNIESTSMIAAERVIYKVNGVNTSFSEMMALPNSQLDNIYWLPWYNNVDLDTQLRFANVSGSPATVHVYVGGTEMSGSPFTLATGASIRKSFAGINKGPVKIESNVDIVAAERVIYKVNGVNTSFSETRALPNSQLDNIYWLPWYNNLDLDTQLRFANVSGSPATVHVYIGGQEVTGSPFNLAAGASTRKSFPGINSGPVKIESNVDIVAAERVIYKVNDVDTSFSEMMGLPDIQIDTSYWLPWYNNVDLDTQLRFGVP